MSYPSLNQCLLDAVDLHPRSDAQICKEGDTWKSISSTEMLRRIAGLAAPLAALGVERGDRIGLFSPNRPEWHIADFAILGLGAVNVPVYFKESDDRMAYILNHSGAKVVISAGAEQARRVLALRPRLPHLQHIICAAADVDMPGDFLRYEKFIASSGEAEIAAWRRRALEAAPSDLATIIYTSGTTGEPKGVMLTHSNFTSNIFDGWNRQDYSEDDLGLEFLPLSHVYERMMGYGYLFRGIAIAYVERMEDVAQALIEVRPTVAAAVPRFFEKIYANLMEKGHKATGLKRRLFDWSMRVVAKATPWRAYGKRASLGVKLEWHLADRLVYRKIRAALGGRIRAFISGGAPLSRDLTEFFAAVGVEIHQGYGLTETSPIISNNLPGSNRIGSVGRPIPNVEVRIAEDGEILVKGPCVMQGYYLKPAETREALPGDGWFRTGDIGHLDEYGYLYVTDRKKDLIKTAAGKFVPPQPIENRLKTSPFILNAVVIGDQRKFVIALIVPHFANVTTKAGEMSLTFSSNTELAAHPWVRELIGKEIERLTAHLAQYESIKRFALLDHDLTFDGGQLTYTMKLRRRYVEQRYAEAIDQLYADVEEPRPQPHA